MRISYILSLLLVGLLLNFSATVSGQDDDEEIEEEDVEVEEIKEPVVVKEKPVYSRPIPTGPTYFVEPFDTRAEYLKRWVPSQAKKDGVEDEIAKYDGKWDVEEARESLIVNDLGLILKSKAKHHAISAKLDRPFEFKGTPLLVQYEVKFQNGMDCGGAYIKLLSTSNKVNLKTFTDKTPYTIMFGPDKCGNDHKLHFIFRHKNPKTGVFEEKHAEKPTAKLDKFFSDHKTHLFTLIINPDNTYEIKVDNGIVASGSLLENVSPPVNPPKEIEDPNDKKPKDWDDREKIPDADAVKPDDWDESEPATILDEDAVIPSGWLEDIEPYIPDPSATKPDDWDEEMDGEWEAPRIENPECTGAPGCGKWERPSKANPKYKGVWKPPMIDNPEYKGKWKPQMIPNPDYFEDLEPYKMTPIVAIGLELWSMSNDILFDNFIIADNSSVLDDFTADTWEKKSYEERAASSTGQSILEAIKNMTDERPWLWAAFILVVVLPIVLIITYCCFSGAPAKGWWEAIKSSTEGRQWLWGVYVMVILLPIVLLSICLCPKSGPLQPEDIDAHRKKFDDVTPDVKDDEEGDEAEGEGSQEEDRDKGARGDGDLEEDKEDSAVEGADEAGDGPDDKTEEDEDKEAGDSPKKQNSPRRRKARKE